MEYQNFVTELNDKGIEMETLKDEYDNAVIVLNTLNEMLNHKEKHWVY